MYLKDMDDKLLKYLGPSTQEAEAGRLEVWGQPELHKEISSFKKERKRNGCGVSGGQLNETDYKVLISSLGISWKSLACGLFLNKAI